jgi:SAM-dependent methyltransferase
MNRSSGQEGEAFYAQTYDESVPDWPGELDFYQELVSEAKRKGQGLLEIACGTGRVTIRLAQAGIHTVGLDISPKMLAVAKEKSTGMADIGWVEADMCSFELGETFGLVIIPGHAFQNLNTPQEQADCMQCIYKHLLPGGRLVVHVDHQDLGWLGDLTREKGGVFEPAEQFRHPQSGHQIRAARAWTYEPATQTAVCTTIWEAVDEAGKIVNHWQTAPIRLHCIFRFEMEHLLARTGFCIEAIYGDFFRTPLEDKSANMIWVASRPESVM